MILIIIVARNKLSKIIDDIIFNIRHLPTLEL